VHGACQVRFIEVSRQLPEWHGTADQIPAVLDEIRAMESYRGHQLFVQEGQQLHKTINCFTWAGCVRLVHEDEQHLNKDYKRCVGVLRL